MSMKNWMKAGLLSTALGLTAATGASAQEAEQEGEKTEVVQQQDYSAVQADRLEIIADGKTIRPQLANRLLGTDPVENGQDVFDANTKIQHMLEQDNMMLSRVLRAERVLQTDSTEITVNGYNGDEKVLSFDADDAPEIEDTPEAAPEQQQQRSRGGADQGRSRSRGNDGPG